MTNKEANRMIDLEKLNHLERNTFQKTIKNYKRKTQNKTINDNLDFEKFSSFNSKLFIKNRIEQNRENAVTPGVEIVITQDYIL